MRTGIIHRLDDLGKMRLVRNRVPQCSPSSTEAEELAVRFCAVHSWGMAN